MGAEEAKKTKPSHVLLAVGVLAIGVWAMTKWASETDAPIGSSGLSADETAAIAAARSVKASLKNPASFSLVSLTKPLPGKDVVCVGYRGTNSFNATVTEVVAVSEGRMTQNYGPCANGGQNFTHLSGLI